MKEKTKNYESEGRKEGRKEINKLNKQSTKYV